MNSRALSILEITGLKDRIIYDDGSNLLPETLTVDYERVNPIIDEWRKKSENYIHESLK